MFYRAKELLLFLNLKNLYYFRSISEFVYDEVIIVAVVSSITTCLTTSLIHQTRKFYDDYQKIQYL